MRVQAVVDEQFGAVLQGRQIGDAVGGAIQVRAALGGEGQRAGQGQGNEHWERTTRVYDADGVPTVKSESLKDYTGEATRVTRFDSADAKTFSKFESDVADLSNFLGWMAEPGQLLRKQIGVWVMLFLFLFLFVAIRMNAAYWKHVR